MSVPNPDRQKQALEYAASRQIRLVNWLGGGTDGDVWQSDRKTAVKAFQYQRTFDVELGCYQRLRDRGIREILGLSVPRLFDWDERLHIVEMDIVTPPYLIDFGKAYLDQAPEHTPEVWQDYYDEQREIWEERFDDVQGILWKLRTIGIYYRDASPRNIRFE
jgi:hypothetical protein